MMKQKSNLVAMSLVPILLSACAPSFNPVANDVAERASDHLGCQSFEDEFWDALYKVVETREVFPDTQTFSTAMKAVLAGRIGSGASAEALEQALAAAYELLVHEAPKTLAADTPDAHLAVLAGLEIGDRTTPEKDRLQTRLRQHLSRVQTLSTQLQLSCSQPGDSSPPPGSDPENGSGTPAPDTNIDTPPPGGATPTPAPGSGPDAPTPPVTPPPDSTGDGSGGGEPGKIGATNLLEWLERDVGGPVGGAWKTLATAYQSCESISLPTVKRGTASAQGIIFTGTHPNGVGRKRMIGDLPLLQRTHYYLKNHSLPDRSCFNVPANPLIYDYGGKPYTTSDTDSRLNLFKDAGSGTSVLGIDCSGFVYTSLATAGLKIKSSGRLKALGVHGVNARMMMEPEKNGLTCLEHATFNSSKSLKAGDIIATGGHVVMVDTASSDPFGLANISSESACTRSAISSERFNFTIIQSSPDKGSLGLNRMPIADYLSLSGKSTLKSNLIDYAVAACKARFGRTSTPKISGASVVRHKGTAACMDRAVLLQNQECLQSCERVY